MYTLLNLFWTISIKTPVLNLPLHRRRQNEKPSQFAKKLLESDIISSIHLSRISSRLCSQSALRLEVQSFDQLRAPRNS